MCDLNASATADILKVILTDPTFDYEGAVRAIYEHEGFSAKETPELSEQLRDLLLENEGRKSDEADEILGCTTINISGGKRRKAMKKARTVKKRSRSIFSLQRRHLRSPLYASH